LLIERRTFGGIVGAVKPIDAETGAAWSFFGRPPPISALDHWVKKGGYLMR